MSISSIEKFSRKLHDNKDPAHGFAHIQRMIEICKVIAPSEANLILIIEAAYFHGLLSAEPKIRAFLISLGFEKSYIEKIIRTISNARSKAIPETIEEQVLHDANILDALGAVGIARAFTKGGYEHQTLTETIDIIQRNMERSLHTSKAKEIGNLRKQFMKNFLNSLEEEVTN
jgi:uncharacterized protein